MQKMKFEYEERMTKEHLENQNILQTMHHKHKINLYEIQQQIEEENKKSQGSIENIKNKINESENLIILAEAELRIEKLNAEKRRLEQLYQAQTRK